MIEKGADGGADLVRDLTYPLPVTVIAEMLGIPAERKEQFKQWSDAAVAAFSLAPDPARFKVAAEEMFEFFVEVIEDRARHPKDDLVSMLVTRGSDGEEPLTVDELVGFCILLLIAGNETTTNLLGNWMRMLVDRPDVEAALRADPSKIAASFEEQLRYDGPVQCLFRGTSAPTEVGGQALDAGTRLLVLFAAANRDEEKWGPDAATYRLDRNPTDHVGFGHGIHLCLGAPLARLEGPRHGRGAVGADVGVRAERRDRRHAELPPARLHVDPVDGEARVAVEPVDALDRIVFLLDRALEPSHRVKAFANARDAIADLDPAEVEARANAGTLTELNHIGPVTASVITEAVKGGHLRLRWSAAPTKPPRRTAARSSASLFGAAWPCSARTSRPKTFSTTCAGSTPIRDIDGILLLTPLPSGVIPEAGPGHRSSGKTWTDSIR